MAARFQTTVDCDISEDMIRVAQSLNGGKHGHRVRYEVRDLEESLPFRDGEASLAVMNMGTASDVRNFKNVATEIARVLATGGRGFISFYNRRALVYQLEALPWNLPLAAHVNPVKNCLDVHGPDGKVYSVHARPYTIEEVREILPPELEVEKLTTYPALSAILSDDLFDNVTLRGIVEEMDRGLIEADFGAYICVEVRRRRRRS
jgi:SAM-dependent methyltransferase